MDICESILRFMFRFGENLSQVQIRRKPYSGSDSERTLKSGSVSDLERTLLRARFGENIVQVRREPYSDPGSESTLFKFGDSLTQVQVQSSVTGSESILYLGSGSERE